MSSRRLRRKPCLFLVASLPNGKPYLIHCEMNSVDTITYPSNSTSRNRVATTLPKPSAHLLTFPALSLLTSPTQAAFRKNSMPLLQHSLYPYSHFSKLPGANTAFSAISPTPTTGYFRSIGIPASITCLPAYRRASLTLPNKKPLGLNLCY